MYTVTFNDGTKIEGLTRRGGIFTRPSPIPEDGRTGHLRNITVTSDDPNETYLVGTHEWLWCGGTTENPEGKGWELLLTPPEPEFMEKLEQTRMRGDIEYLSMMTGVDLDE